MAFSDKVNPEDRTWMSLSQPPPIEEMPGALLCPAGHRAYGQVVELADPEHGTVRAPVYGCVPCQVVYRYQECRLPPGEEGLPGAGTAAA